MNLLDLAENCDQIADQIPTFANEIAKDVGSTILTDLVQVTPVDTGEALSNWQASLAEPSLEQIAAYVPSPKGRMKDGAWSHAVDPSITAQANIAPTLEAGMMIIKSKQHGIPLFISNNSEYIVVLDQGSSTQAPAGFVDRAIILGSDVVNKARLIL